MSSSTAVARTVHPAHGFAYSGLCVVLAAAGFATGQVVEALLLLLGVVAYVALVATRTR
jgi:hypothetical protein